MPRIPPARSSSIVALWQVELRGPVPDEIGRQLFSPVTKSWAAGIDTWATNILSGRSAIQSAAQSP